MGRRLTPDELDQLAAKMEEVFKASQAVSSATVGYTTVFLGLIEWLQERADDKTTFGDLGLPPAVHAAIQHFVQAAEGMTLVHGMPPPPSEVWSLFRKGRPETASIAPEYGPVTRTLPGAFWVDLYASHARRVNQSLGSEQLDADTKQRDARQLETLLDAAIEGAPPGADDEIAYLRQNLKEMLPRLGVRP